MSQYPEPKHQDEFAVRCKVCSKKIRHREAHLKVYHGLGEYAVCCIACAAKFEAAPRQYLMMP